MKLHLVKDIHRFVLIDFDEVKLEPLSNWKIRPELINASNYSDLDKIVAYLKSGGKHSTVATMKECEYCDEFAGPVNYFTDGVWMWPQWIIHYLVKHGLKLPEEFVNSIRHNDYKFDEELVKKIISFEIEIDFK